MQIENIKRGEHGWKRRRTEIAILQILDDANVPHCPARMNLKLARRFASTCEDDIARYMRDLCQQGHIKLVGHDDADPLYFRI